jgi:excinuclease UvrABC nuclease subunit
MSKHIASAHVPVSPLGPISYKQSSKHIAGPGVYALWLGDEPLYIGYGRIVGNRARKRGRGHWGRHLAFKECDRIEIYPCDSIQQARQLETELIGLYSPRYNGNGHFQSSRSLERLRFEHDKVFA